jgi:tetratricopeptide (TPR) repeat protein
MPTLSALATLQNKTDSGIDLPRPRLPPGADTNAAIAYYALGHQLAEYGEKLDTAELAFFWASRLDPAWAEPVFARAVVLLRARQLDAFETWRLTGSVGAVKRVDLTARQLRTLDSLSRIAWARSPFVLTGLELPPFPPMGSLQDPAHAGWISYTMGHFATADSAFAIALREHPEDVLLRLYRAKALFSMGRYDSAVAQIAAARDTIQRETDARLSPVVPSVEMLEYAIGIARVQQDDFPSARAAFERALTQDLGFYWAHARLAGVAMALRDTASALTELDAALGLEGSDPVLRLYDGVVLHAVGRDDEAAAQLRCAIELDPYYAKPYYWLGVVYRAQGKATDAIRQYSLFLAHAAHQDPDRASAAQALDRANTTQAIDRLGRSPVAPP